MMRSFVACAIISVVTIISSLAVTAFAQQSSSQMFERARMYDEANTNLAEAIKLYNQVASQTKDRSLAARAHYYAALVYKRLGRKAESQRGFKTIVSQYQDQTDVAQRAEARIITPGVKGKGKDVYSAL